MCLFPTQYKILHYKQENRYTCRNKLHQWLPSSNVNFVVIDTNKYDWTIDWRSYFSKALARCSKMYNHFLEQKTCIVWTYNLCKFSGLKLRSDWQVSGASFLAPENLRHKTFASFTFTLRKFSVQESGYVLWKNPLSSWSSNQRLSFMTETCLK